MVCGERLRWSREELSAGEGLPVQKRGDLSLRMVYRWGEGDRFGCILEVDLVIPDMQKGWGKREPGAKYNSLLSGLSKQVDGISFTKMSNN